MPKLAVVRMEFLGGGRRLPRVEKESPEEFVWDTLEPKMRRQPMLFLPGFTDRPS